MYFLHKGDGGSGREEETRRERGGGGEGDRAVWLGERRVEVGCKKYIYVRKRKK